MRISDWSSDVCSSDLDREVGGQRDLAAEPRGPALHGGDDRELELLDQRDEAVGLQGRAALEAAGTGLGTVGAVAAHPVGAAADVLAGSAEHDSAQCIEGRLGLEGPDNPAVMDGLDTPPPPRAVDTHLEDNS